MRTPTIKGQFRYVQDTHDGCSIYQCLWCLKTIEIRDDPRYWNFCPKCGKSWFNKLECRNHNVPRWAYDRYGNNCPMSAKIYPSYKYPEWEWVIEERTNWYNDSWSDWIYETSCKISHGMLGAWREAQCRLNMYRARVTNGTQCEYRAIKRKIK